MLLTLDQTAAKLGKTRRQIQYMIRQNRLAARKVGNRWLVDDKDLPLSPKQQDAKNRKQRKFKAAIEDALDVSSGKNAPERYSMADMKAFQISSGIYRSMCDNMDKDHPSIQALWECILELGRGCHRFNRQEKLTAYNAARDHAAEAVCHLYFADQSTSTTLGDQIEQELMPAIAGLLRRLDHRRSKNG